jgi:hypothetical protein
MAAGSNGLVEMREDKAARIGEMRGGHARLEGNL